MARKMFLLGLFGIVVLPSCMNTAGRDATAAISARMTEVVDSRPISYGAADATGSYMIGKVTQLSMQEPVQADATASVYPVR